MTQILSGKLTPMMQQWVEAKRQHTDAVLLFRMGDFYELFGDDAVLAAPILELALTSRDKDKSGLKMAGFPVHAAENYIQKLVNQGHKIAICEQLEDPKKNKGIVKRGITEVVTPGTQIDGEDNNTCEFSFLVALTRTGKKFFLCALDIKTGTFLCTSNICPEKICDEICRLRTKELIINSQDKHALELALKSKKYCQTKVNFRIEIQDNLHSCVHEDFDKILPSLDQDFIPVTKLIWSYVCTLRGAMPGYVRVPRRYSLEHHLIMDQSTQENLDLFAKNSNDQANLFAILDYTKTAMGRRKLRHMMSAPLGNIEKIIQNQNIVEEFLNNHDFYTDFVGLLKQCYDIEKLTALAVAQKIGPRGLGRVRNCLEVFIKLANLIKSYPVPNIRKIILSDLELPSIEILFQELEQALVDNPPIKQGEGGIFKTGFNSELDNLNFLAQEGQSLLLKLESQERQKLNIPSLKIKYTRVFGYYLEITKTHLHKVPDYYQRKQTVANGERYITEALSKLEIKLKTAAEKRLKLEQELFEKLRQIIAKNSTILMTLGSIFAYLDVLSGFAECAQKYDYVRPHILPKDAKKLEIILGRHPIIEHLCLESGAHFVANTIKLDTEENMLIITGPNMAGKSTVMRQAALIQVMAQMGSFVPAKEARISICDMLFARVGASDDLGRGRSTFMVEMSETGYILNNASSFSLILLDEIGRGTSTYDGMAIAQSVVEYIHDTLKTRTLFATHYHELTELEKNLKNLKNFHVEVENSSNKINFLYTLKSGPATDSFGVEVAKLAGLPTSIISRANYVLEKLENKPHNFINYDVCKINSQTGRNQLSFFNSNNSSNITEKIISRIKKYNLSNTTPLRALQELDKLQKIISRSC